MKTFYKKIFAAAFFATPVVYLACNRDNLEIPSPTQTEGTFFTSQSEFNTAMVGTYAVLTDYYSSSNGSGGFGNAVLQAWFLPGDDLSVPGGNSFETFKGLGPTNASLNQVWKSSYVLIGRANKILQKIASAPDAVFTSPAAKNAIAGEGYFLRAFAHFQLWNLFGTAPVDTIIPKSTSEFNLPSSKGVELLDQAVADLTRAATLLPSSWGAQDIGRVTSNSANGMLGKVLVFRASATKSTADYQAAIAAFDKITGAKLVDNFEDNFNVAKENNEESLFEFQAGVNIQGSGQNAWLGNDVCDCGVAGAYYQMFSDGAGGYMGGGVYDPTSKLKNAFTANDPRLYYTLDSAKAKIVKYVRDGGPGDGAVNSTNNHRILRYADVLLLKAEAILQSGGSTVDAISLINDVRQRARKMGGTGSMEPADLSTAETNKTTIMQWIMDERLRELAAEGHRWFDLRRWQMAGYITLNNAFFDSDQAANMEFKTTNLLFPIPSVERDVNPNVVQNPGY